MSARVLVVGLGSIGRRHLANLRALEPGADVTVLRHARSEEPLVAGADRYAYSLEEALQHGPEAALICGPASTHLDIALALAGAGIHLFVEKPLAHATAGAEELVALCDRCGLVAMVGYNLRFLSSLGALHDALERGAIGRIHSIRAEVGQYLPDWRPGVDYRRTASASAALGGGAVLELSHELDYVRWLGGEIAEVSATTGRLGDLEIDVEDTAEIVLRLASGALASIHLDMLQRAPVRLCRVTGSEGTLVWDGIADELRSYSAATRTWTAFAYPRLVDRAQTYLAELREFLACIRTGAMPRVTLRDGLRALEIASAVKLSAREGRAVVLGGIGVA